MLGYLALGDSYTIGEAVAPSQRWPEQLARALRHEGVALAPPRIVAVTGWTTDELEAGMDATALDARYELVSLLIGVNDQYRGRSAGRYRDPFRHLLARAVGLAGDRPGRVLVVSIPDWGVTPFGRGSGRDIGGIAHALDVYNAIARDEAGRAGARFVDITPVSRRHPDLVAEDGLHPDGRQYTRWTGAILPVARAALRR